LDTPAHLREQYQYFTEADMSKSFAAGLSKPQWTLESGVSDYLKNYLLKPRTHF
jgi:ADP-L-glycero-D-manno-heptose 6-epimerase